MTRFKQEISGKLGEYWQKHAREEVEKCLSQKDEMTIEEDGAAKWKSSGNYIPEDIVEKLIYGGADWFSPEATAVKRKKQDEEFIKKYRENPPVMTEERLFEMKAAFGEGATVVDIITGERYHL